MKPTQSPSLEWMELVSVMVTPLLHGRRDSADIIEISCFSHWGILGYAEQFPSCCFRDSVSLTFSSFIMMYLGVELFLNPTWSVLSCSDDELHQVWGIALLNILLLALKKHVAMLWRQPHDRRWRVASMSWEHPLRIVSKKAGTSALYP